jgi:hypothetical protein
MNLSSQSSPYPFTEEFDFLEKGGGNNTGLNYTSVSVLTFGSGIVSSCRFFQVLESL